MATSFPCARRLIALVAVLSLFFVPALQAQDNGLLREFEQKVTSFTLDNGLTFVVVERPDAPVVSFHTYADVGSVDEPMGKTGIAHMFEHMAFKGTTSIGTEDIEAEMEDLQRMEEVYLELRRERVKGPQADSSRVARLEEQFQEAQEAAEAHIADGEYENLLERNGVSGLNAYTSSDATGYIYSLPANKLELFFALESDRFMNPVLRDFYTERDVVMEERRQRTDSNPVGCLVEEFLATAYKAHPYGQPTIGHMSDLQKLSRTDAKRFYDTYYNASNLTIGIAGDVDAQRVRALAEQYFSRLPAGEDPMPVRTDEPEQIGERRVIIREQTQPFVVIGHHRPGMEHPDDPVYGVLRDVLGRGRTSRLYKNLVETNEALSVQVIPSFPGSKYESLFVLFGVPSQGVAPDSLEQQIYTQIDRIKDEGITQAELERAKTRARADLIGQLDSNSGLARQLSRMEALTGDWRNVFRQLNQLQAVTAADVQRVAQETFQRSNRTVGMIKTQERPPPAAASRSGEASPSSN